MNVSKCSSCGRAIVWATSPNGARMPVTARPVTTYTLVEGELMAPPNAVKVEAEDKHYISHFVDCPNAAQHSTKG